MACHLAGNSVAKFKRQFTGVDLLIGPTMWLT